MVISSEPNWHAPYRYKKTGTLAHPGHGPRYGTRHERRQENTPAIASSPRNPATMPVSKVSDTRVRYWPYRTRECVPRPNPSYSARASGDQLQSPVPLRGEKVCLICILTSHPLRFPILRCPVTPGTKPSPSIECQSGIYYQRRMLQGPDTFQPPVWRSSSQ
ncbi:hypothetical protein BJV77DRAFT_54955 [Russula vinacea]|nr:hypothetical protein BJV77DRAFT_54955 [Russula vinacea]